MALVAALGLQVASFAAPAAATDLSSVNIHGVSGNGSSSGVALNTNGSIAVFYSDANDLVPGDTNQARDVFVRDRNAGTTERVSVSNSGAQANGPSQTRGMAAAISDSGNIVAFYSDASNLVSNDDNGTTDVFVRDRQAHTTTLVSVNLSGRSGNRPSLFPSISADGRLVAFQSAASDLVPGDTNSATDIFVRDLQAGTTERLCGVQPNASSFSPSISSGDGNFVAFVSAATNLDPNVTPGILNVFVCDRAAGTVKSVSVSSAGVPGNGDSMTPAISGDGRFVAFKSESNNLVPSDTNGVVDVFVHDRVAGTTERISVSFSGGNSNEVSFPPAISDDGRFVAFGSAATNLVPNDANGAADVFVRDRQTDVTLLVDLAPNGQQADGGTPDVAPAISGDGTQIGFVSFATNLVPNDGNQLPDVFATENPFVCPPCPTGFMCVNGFCVSKTPSVTPTPTPTGPTPTPTETATPTETPTPRHCIGTEDCEVGQVCVDGFCVFPPPTPTPIHCTDNSKCPEGQICACPAGDPLCAPSQKFCQPAISPTPTLTPTPIPTCKVDADCPPKPCSTPGECLPDHDCVEGQCSPADRCVDGVCAPTRPCGPDKACIIDRETCLNDVCECGGDCDLNGFVFANEIAKMICMLSNDCPPSGCGACPASETIPADCQAGDLNQDGGITGDEICKAVTNLGVGCPLGFQDAAAMAAAAQETRTFELTGPGERFRGQPVEINIALTGGPAGVKDVATAQLDVLFNTQVLRFVDCAVNPLLSTTDLAFTFLPRRPDTLPNVERLRVFVADLDVCTQNFTPSSPAIGNGPLVSCDFVVTPTAPLGQSTVIGDPEETKKPTNLGDMLGNEIPSTATDTHITVVPQTCQVNEQCPSGLLCRNGICEPECPEPPDACPPGTVCRTGACVPECTPESGCPDDLVCQNSFCTSKCTQDTDCSFGLVCRDNACVPPCATPSDCPAGSVCVDGGCVTGQCAANTDCSVPARQACMLQRCVCGGDCNGDGIVDTAEILRMVSIFGGATPLDTCPAGDINGDHIITTNEILAAVFNFGAGCPGSGS